MTDKIGELEKEIEKLKKEVANLKDLVKKPKTNPIKLKFSATLSDEEHNVIGYFSDTVASNCEP